MKDIIKPAVILLIITAVAAALLGMVSEITAPAIAAQTAKTQSEAMKQVLPNAEEFKLDESAELTGTMVSVNVGYSGGEICGYVINVRPNGFGGAIDTMVGISSEGTIEGLNILSHAETPGLGAKAKEPAFYEQFAGKVSAPLSVIKAGTPAETEIQAITSATITSQAVADGANEAYDWFVKNGGAK